MLFLLDVALLLLLLMRLPLLRLHTLGSLSQLLVQIGIQYGVAMRSR